MSVWYEPTNGVRFQATVTGDVNHAQGTVPLRLEGAAAWVYCAMRGEEPVREREVPCASRARVVNDDGTLWRIPEIERDKP